MNLMSKILAVLMVCVLCLSMTACTTSQVVTSLSAITACVQVVMPTILSGISSDSMTDAQKLDVKNYVSSVLSAITKSTTELQTNDTNGTKISMIVSYLSAAVAPNLNGLPSAVATSVSAIAAVISVYISQNKTGVYSATHNQKFSLAVEKPSRQDKKEISNIQKTVTSLQLELLGAN